MKNWIKSFFAVDNTVNEQSVIGVFWGFVSFVLVILHVAGVEKAGIDLLIMSSSSMLLCFGIAGAKKGM